MEQHAPRRGVLRELRESLRLELVDDHLAQLRGVVDAVEHAHDRHRSVIVANDARDVPFERLEHHLALPGARVRHHHVDGVRAVPGVDHAEHRGARHGVRGFVTSPRPARQEVLGEHFVNQRRGHEALLEDGQERLVHLAEHALALCDGLGEHRLAQGRRRLVRVSGETGSSEHGKLRAVKFALHVPLTVNGRGPVQGLEDLRAHRVLRQHPHATFHVGEELGKLLLGRRVDEFLNDEVTVEGFGERAEVRRALGVHRRPLVLGAVLEQGLDDARRLVVVGEDRALPLASLEDGGDELALVVLGDLLHPEPLPERGDLLNEGEVGLLQRLLLVSPVLLLPSRLVGPRGLAVVLLGHRLVRGVDRGLFRFLFGGGGGCVVGVVV